MDFGIIFILIHYTFWQNFNPNTIEFWPNFYPYTIDYGFWTNVHLNTIDYGFWGNFHGYTLYTMDVGLILILIL